MLGRTLTAAALILTLAAPAWAGSKLIVTPSLVPPSNGALGCILVNASETKSLEVNVSIRTTDGSPAGLGFGTALLPRSSVSVENTQDQASYCVIEIVSGSSKNARVTVWVKDASGELTAAVAAPGK
ncbi:MAG: hypothetical protein JRG85_11330 [Deltaproteobacteria bacterium]|nr:hypothetical protein [Deltaproteobacteria bacterium]